MLRSQSEWIRAYTKKDALWMHGGDAAQPHALLASGKHSTGFFNSRLIIGDEPLLTEAAHDLVEHFARWGDLNNVQVVVGPQTGATVLARLIAERISHLRQQVCLTASPAKGEDGKPSLFTQAERGFLKGMRVLLCEDVITTGGSVRHTADAVEAAGGRCLPYLLALVDRSGMARIDGRQVIALIDRPMPAWEPDTCPLCKQGSKVLRPKDNWRELAS